MSIYPYYQPLSPPPPRYVLLPLLDFRSVIPSTLLETTLSSTEFGGGPDRTQKKLAVAVHPYFISQLCRAKPHGVRATSYPPPMMTPQHQVHIYQTLSPSQTPPSSSQPPRSLSQPPRSLSQPPCSSSHPPGTPRAASLRRSPALALLPVVEEDKDGVAAQVESEHRRVHWNHTGDTDEDELESDSKASRRHKPSGDTGRPSRGGYKLSDALGIPLDEYTKMKNAINDIVARHCDHRKQFKAQGEDAKKHVRAEVKATFPRLVQHYIDAWPVDDFINARLKYTAGRHSQGRPVPQHLDFKL
ncbi:hypothetical protein PUNSTDRAFT_128945 [Punctularia strigosozonata HHB-11173 SS5]|uniref:uncharacterized protein n=1 Tax=Punctularia strigosozonata (strain HHB-11173) TaxID=741275 RepID=UPI000441676D|nr:uncharacterized protein PUNSTDRAFT_128945 [Punctularia strigosozonata HHB-11173 SS5]EIN13258.1 hypothetical protein PUNSTDRAFT_128945 [Punctularia strigosozonata HHB-11173 SS5]